MSTATHVINMAAFLSLFFDYAVAMQRVEPCGTRRTLQIYSKQLPTGAVAGYVTLSDPLQASMDVV